VENVSRHPGSVWIEQNRSSLHGDRWIAASGDGLEAESNEVKDLMDILRKKQVDPKDVAITFITSDAI
jgi:hypothetical protein